MNREIVIIAYNIRSCFNVGSLLRTAEGLGVSHIYFSGYTPYPKMKNDSRMPHIVNKINKQITKVSLGSENFISWSSEINLDSLIIKLKTSGYLLAGLEQNKKSENLIEFNSPNKIAILLGNEATGLLNSELDDCDIILEIPMKGKKESFNVIEAATMAMYHCSFF